MKKNTTIIIFSLLCICLLFACSRHHRYRIHDSNLDLSVTESNSIYRLNADYNDNKTGAIQSYINGSIEPNGFFSSTEDYFDVSTELKDHTKFHIKSSPGKLEIKFYKRENSYASYKRIKKMCEGVAGILKEQ
ncbi:MAG: hypothetical protein ABJC98_24230 [Bacteroidota bacterium]